jgi:glyoxylase-like metal-dependent hydrolase (beta-lactamase superfamily II)
VIDAMLISTFTAPPFHKNGYLLSSETTRDAVVIDPGDEVEEMIAAAARLRVRVQAILLTHAHLDHITGVSRARSAFGASVYLHAADLPLYHAVVQQGLMFGLTVEPQPEPDLFYESDTRIRFGEYGVSWRHAPGHSPGSVCLEVRGVRDSSPQLFVGDVLFAGSIGRTDLPGGDYQTLIGSIRTVLLPFPDETPVYSGHGEPTTIGRERRSNPFLQQTD